MNYEFTHTYRNTNMWGSHSREETAGVNPGITATLMSRFTVRSDSLVQQLFPPLRHSQSWSTDRSLISELMKSVAWEENHTLITFLSNTRQSTDKLCKSKNRDELAGKNADFQIRLYNISSLKLYENNVLLYMMTLFSPQRNNKSYLLLKVTSGLQDWETQAAVRLKEKSMHSVILRNSVLWQETMLLQLIRGHIFIFISVVNYNYSGAVLNKVCGPGSRSGLCADKSSSVTPNTSVCMRY